MFLPTIDKKGKTSSMKEDGATPFNVATNVIFIQSNSATNYQSLSYLSPKNWLNKAYDSPCNIISYELKEKCAKENNIH